MIPAAARDDPTGRVPRARARQKIFHPTEVRATPDAPPRRAHLIDLSTSGAQVHTAFPPAAGDRVFLGDGTHARFATVAWVKGSRFGVAFVRPLGDAEFADFLATQRAVAAG